MTGRAILFLRSDVGKDGKPFQAIQICHDAKEQSQHWHRDCDCKNDPRVLPMGHFLRKTKINKLPQLLNILLGSMSVDGPQPQAQKNFNAFP